MDAKRQQELFSEMEVDMMTDLYNRCVRCVRAYFTALITVPHIRLATSCQKKCIPPRYHDGDLTKGEAICLDRCVGKFMEIHDKVGKKLTEMYMQDEALAKQLQTK